MIKKSICLMFLLLLAFQVSVFAAVNVGQRTGTLKITLTNGTVLTVAPGDPLPIIPDGANIEVIGGIANISVTGTSTVQVIAGGQVVNVAIGSSLNVSIEPTGTAVIGVTEGSAQIVTHSGATAIIDRGDQVRVGSGVVTPTGFDVVQGQVVLTQTDGTTTTHTPGTGVEGYQPPALPSVSEADTTVQTEETTADISPIAQ
ncbi:MAG: hypothetical protein WCI27_03090 [Candidatus Omnitrophota bacterium]